MDLNEVYASIIATIEEEHTFATVAERIEHRKRINSELSVLTGCTESLVARVRHLPELPPLRLVQWAQAVQELPNLVFLVLDTTGVEDNSDIIRILIADRSGKPLFDQLIKPQRQQTANSTYTGIAWEKLEAAPRLAALWLSAKHVLMSRYVLAYNLEFVRSRLDENAKHYSLPPMTLIGECLQGKAHDFWKSHYPPRLVDLCNNRIGYPLPFPCTALDRAAGQHAVLEAMAQGILDTFRHEAAPLADDADILQLDDHPF